MTTIMTLSLALALGSTGQCTNPAHRHHKHDGAFYRDFHGSGGFIEPDGPGNGWGFPNGTPDEYGWHDQGPYLPLGANRTADYYFRRYFSVPPEQAFLGIYYNPYVNRGQRYLPYTGNGGDHPMGGPPLASAITSQRPYSTLSNAAPVTAIPSLRGRVEARWENSGKTGLTP
jgi:hypothetical protein